MSQELDALGRDYSIDFNSPAARGMLDDDVLAYYNGKTPMYDGAKLTMISGDSLTVQAIKAMVVTFHKPHSDVRREALEEAARVCEHVGTYLPNTPKDCAERIRALIDAAQ